MRDNDQRCAHLGAAGEQQVDDAVAGGGIEIAGRLVGEDQAGVRGDGAGDGDALLFAAGKLGGIMRDAVAKADGFELRVGTGARIGHSRQLHRRRDIFQRGHRWQQMEGLKDNSDASPAGAGKSVFVHRGEIFASNRQSARCRPLKA